MKKTVVELDLVGYSTICDNLEEALDVQSAAQLNQQIHDFIEAGLTAVNAVHDQTVVKTTGDGAILAFDSAQDAHQFAQAVHDATRKHNQSRKRPLAKRVFRSGAATGEIVMEPKPGGGFDVAGMTIARAVRLEAKAQPGGLLIDEATYESLSDDQKSGYGPKVPASGKRDEEFEARACQLNADGPKDAAFFTEQTRKEAPPATKELDTRADAVVLTGHVERYPVEADFLPDHLMSVSESRAVRKLVDPFFMLLRVSNTLGHERVTRLRTRLHYFDDQWKPYQFGTARGVWFRQPKQDEVPQVFLEPIEIDRGDDADLVLAIKHPRQEPGFAFDERSPHVPGWDHAELCCARDFHVKVELWSDSFELVRCFRLSFVGEWQGMNISEIRCPATPQSSADSEAEKEDAHLAMSKVAELSVQKCLRTKDDTFLHVKGQMVTIPDFRGAMRTFYGPGVFRVGSAWCEYARLVNDPSSLSRQIGANGVVAEITYDHEGGSFTIPAGRWRRKPVPGSAPDAHSIYGDEEVDLGILQWRDLDLVIKAGSELRTCFAFDNTSIEYAPNWERPGYKLTGRSLITVRLTIGRGSQVIQFELKHKVDITGPAADSYKDDCPFVLYPLRPGS